MTTDDENKVTMIRISVDDPTPIVKVEYAWATALAEKKAFVLHTGTGVVARCKRFWSGTDADCFSEDAKFALIEMETGDTLTAIEDNFVELTEDEAKFSELATRVLAHAIKETISLAASSGAKIQFNSACVLVEAAVQAQLRSLQKQRGA